MPIRNSQFAVRLRFSNHSTKVMRRPFAQANASNACDPPVPRHAPAVSAGSPLRASEPWRPPRGLPRRTPPANIGHALQSISFLETQWLCIADRSSPILNVNGMPFALSPAPLASPSGAIPAASPYSGAARPYDACELHDRGDARRADARCEVAFIPRIARDVCVLGHAAIDCPGPRASPRRAIDPHKHDVSSAPRFDRGTAHRLIRRTTLRNRNRAARRSAMRSR